MKAISSRSILVVEDSEEDFNTVQEAARLSGLTNQIRRATTGNACMAMLRGRATESGRAGLLLLDLNTPGLDGCETLIAIRTDPALTDLPVVILSASSSPEDVTRCLGLGANAYHVKPTHYADHLNLIREVLSYWLRKVILPKGSKGAQRSALP